MADNVQNTTSKAVQPARSATDSRSGLAPRERGHTYIADDVISVIARIAAEQVEGVNRIGSSNLRTLWSRRTSGISAEAGLKEAAVEVELVVEFGHSIKDVTEEVRERIIESVERTTGRRVVEVDIFVTDVNVPKVERRPRRQLE